MTIFWKVRGQGERNGSDELLALTVQTDRKHPDAASEAFTRAASDIGYSNVEVDDTMLLREE